MANVVYSGEALWTRMERAVDKVRARLERTVRALQSARIPYALIGGHAVRAWVAQVDDSAVRTTRDVELLIDRTTLTEVIVALEAAGFTYQHVAGIDMFLESPDAKPGDAIHLVLSGEKIREQDELASPLLSEQTQIGDLSVISLESLVRMKLTAYRLKDQMLQEADR